jgi:uncharacterized membrane protein
MKSAGQGTTAGMKYKKVRWSSAEAIAFIAFVIWSVAGLIFTLQHITPSAIAHWQLPDALTQFIVLCLQWGDPILILLAFTNTHLHAARQWSDGIARRWCFIVVVFAYGIETLGTKTGIPFGEYHYTGDFGPMLGLVPLTIPLAWHVVVTNALFLVRAIVPHTSRIAEAVVTGLLCTMYDFVLEPFATTIKHYWIWTEGAVPPLNYVAWFVLSAMLVGIFAPTVSTRYRLDPRPLLILLFTITIFFAGEMK